MGDNIREFGRIERILNRFYSNGQLQVTTFKMEIFSPGKAKWSGKTKYRNFYGEIPPEFVGQEARYFYTEIERDGSIEETASIEVGKITLSGEGIHRRCGILPIEGADPRVPKEISSRFVQDKN